MLIRFDRLRTAVLGLVVLAAGATAPAFAAERTSFNVAWSIYVGWMPWDYAQQSGILKKWADKYAIKIKLTDVLVSSYNVGGTQVGGDPAPRDSFSLNFVRIEMTETSQSPTGGLGAAAFGGFDFQGNAVVPPSTT